MEHASPDGERPRRAEVSSDVSPNEAWVRGHRADYDGWAQRCPGWSYDEVLPYFQRAEHRLGSNAGWANRVVRRDGAVRAAFLFHPCVATPLLMDVSWKDAVAGWCTQHLTGRT